MRPTFALICLLPGILFAVPQAAAEATAPDMAQLRKAALQIDRQVAAFFRNQKLPVPAVTDDATFLRRAFLVAIGRIPTAEEALAFLEIEDPDKREQLVEYLMSRPGIRATCPTGSSTCCA